MATLPQELLDEFGANGTLAADPGSSGTTLTLTTGHGARFATVTSGVNQFRLLVDNENMLVTAHGASADTMTVTRGIEGTTATAHAVGASVYQVTTAAALRRHVPYYLPHPRQNKMLAWTFPPYALNGTFTPTAGTVYYSKIFIPEDMTVTGCVVGVSTNGTGATSLANCYVALYGPTGTRLALSADRASDLNTGSTTPGNRLLPFTGTVGLTGGAETFVVAALLIGTQSTTNLVFRAIGSQAFNLGNLANADVYNSFTRSGDVSLSAMPATADPTTTASTVAAPWMGLY